MVFVKFSLLYDELKQEYRNVCCYKGFDGGLPASFLLQIFDAETMNLRSRKTKSNNDINSNGEMPYIYIKSSLLFSSMSPKLSILYMHGHEEKISFCI